MVILTKLIISNIKNIKANYIFFDLDFDFIFEDEDIYKTDFDNEFIQKIIMDISKVIQFINTFCNK